MVICENCLLIVFSVFVIIFFSFVLKKIMANTSENNPHDSKTDTATNNEEEENNIRVPSDCDLQTIEDFGYRFNDAGELRDIETDQFYNFNYVEGDQKLNQKRYEKLGNVITEYVYDLLESETNLKRVYIPEDAEENEARSFIFMSNDALTNPDKLMILIHGSGAVRAGQWSRKLIINDNLDKGTQLPYVKRGIKQGYGIIVLNGNLNKIKSEDGTEYPVKKNEDAEKHGHYVWKNFVLNAKAKNIAIVAHSYGGIVTLELANEFKEDFMNRVFAIAFTDSVHSVRHQELDEDLVDLIKTKAINYVSSNADLGEPERDFERLDCPRVSAGTNQHELTSWSCMEFLFEFLNDQYTKVSEKTENANSKLESQGINGHSSQDEKSDLESETPAEVQQDIEMYDKTRDNSQNENEKTNADADIKDAEIKDAEIKDAEIKDAEIKEADIKDSEVKDAEVKDESSSEQTVTTDRKEVGSLEQKDNTEVKDVSGSKDKERAEIQGESQTGSGDGIKKTTESEVDETKAEKKDNKEEL